MANGNEYTGGGYTGGLGSASGAKGGAYKGQAMRGEATDLKASISKANLWSSLGRTLGWGAVMLATGGSVNPITLGILVAASSYGAGKAGKYLAERGDPIEGGHYYKGTATTAETELDTQNLTASIMSGITSGISAKKAQLHESSVAATEWNIANPDNLKTAKDFPVVTKGLDWEGSELHNWFGEGKMRVHGKNLMDYLDEDLAAHVGPINPFAEPMIAGVPTRRSSVYLDPPGST